MTTNTATTTRASGGRALGWINIVALVLALAANTLGTTGAIGEADTGELSDRFASLFTPAGYVFGIWGIIYTLLLIFAVYQVLPAQRNNPRLERLGYAFALSCLFNAGWIFAWQFQLIALSQILMLGLLLTLIACYRRLGIGSSRSAGWGETLALRLPFSVYLGWITVATVANTTVLLLTLGFTGGAAAPLWTVIAIAAAVAIGVLVLARRRDIAFNLVLVWALAGIAARQWALEPLVVGGAVVAAGVLALAIGVVLLRRPAPAAAG